jgi:ribosomal protein S20
MSISGVNGTDARALFYQRRLDFKALAAEVEAGDATAAQAALQSYQKDVQSTAPAAASTDAADSNAPSDFVTWIKTDLSNLTAAVQSGNMTDAQTALTAYENDRDTQFGAAPAPSNDASSSFVTDLASLIQSVQSGDTSGIKTSSAALTKDVQSLSQSGGAHGAHHHHHHHAGPLPTDADGATQTSLLGDPPDQNGNGTTTGSAASSDNPLSAQAAALDQFVKQFTESLEQFEQSMQQKTV